MITTAVKTEKGDEYPAIFNNSVLMKLASECGIKTGEYLIFLGNMSQWDMPTSQKLFRYMLYVGGLLDSKPFTISSDDFEDWLYVFHPELIDQLSMVFFESLPEVVHGPADVKKKKPTTGK